MIRAVVKHRKPPVRTYPKLMVSEDGLIVLMESYGEGTIVNENIRFGIGYHEAFWNMQNFKNFHGSITLEYGE